MLNFRIADIRFLAVMAFAFLASAPAFAATYQIGLFQGTTGTGSGSFTFTNPGTPGTFPTAGNVTLSTNASSSIGAQTFVPGPLTVNVVAVNFSDGKNPPNTITGNYVEGLTGSLSTTPQQGALGCNQQQDCFYRITFSFTANTNPNLAVKTYTIDVVRLQGNQVLSTPVLNQPYSVSNTSTIPEPGSMALLAMGLATLAWVAFARRRQTATRRGTTRG